MSFQLHTRSPYGMNAVRLNSSRPLTAATGETVQLAPASTANLAAGDGAAAALAAAGAQPQIEPGRAGGRICLIPKLHNSEADTVVAGKSVASIHLAYISSSSSKKES